ncbi:solute carrier family 22 member 6 [Dermacentor silvarum]|uniref:solute carrier family 22 member 6 n=1 Tax=Dermacentor silvarum TaxID=543639 RepID=UPI00189A3462|nr:solute carrier family 22 member 6 [Dermacentor silvarum]
MPRSMSNTPRRKKKGSAIRSPKQPSSEPATSGVQDRDIDGTQHQLQECGTTIYGHGDFQRLLCCFVILTLVVLHCHSQASALVARPVDHWCRPPSKFADLSTARWKNVGVPVDDAGNPSECLAYVRPGHQPNDTETVECDEWDYDAAEARRSARSFWNLVCHRTWLLSLANAVYMSGALFVVPVAGCLADTYGRKLVIVSGVAVLLLSTLATCLARTYPLYLVTRFFNSACASTVFVVALILLYEVAPLAYRVFYVGISCSLGAFLADVFLLIVAVFPLSWTLLQVVILSPTVLLVLAACAVHESPAWLLVLCRVDEAEAVMLEAARVNDVHRVTARQAIQRLRTDINRSEATYSSRAVAPGAEVRGAHIAGVFVVTFTLMLGIYGLTWSSRMRKDATISIVSVILSAPSYVGMYLALMTLGRLQFLLAAMSLLGGTCLLFAVAVSANPRVIADALLVVAQCCARVLAPANYLYVAELFPTSMRSTVLCSAYACGRLGAVVASAIAMLEDVGREDLEFAVVGSAVFGGVAVLMRLPETSRGLTDIRSAGGTERDVLKVMQETLNSAPPRPRHKRQRSLSKTRP